MHIDYARWRSTHPPIMGGQPTDTDPDVESLTLLERLQAKRQKVLDALSEKVTAREAERTEFEQRSTTDEDRTAFNDAETRFAADFDQLEAESKSLQRRVREQEAVEEQRTVAARADASPRIGSITEPLTYRRDNAWGPDSISYFRDLAYTEPRIAGHLGGSQNEALERLHRHAKETESWLPKRAAERAKHAEEALEEAERSASKFWTGTTRGLTHSPFEQLGAVSPFERRVNPNRTDGQGGEFVQYMVAA